MNTNLPVLRLFLTWLLFIPVAIINGSVRQFFYQKYLGELRAHQLSSIIGSLLFIIFAYILARRQLAGLSSSQLFLTGLCWLGLTLIFEFSMGLAAGRSWQYMLADYNLRAGRLWLLVLMAIFFAPLLVKYLSAQTGSR